MNKFAQVAQQETLLSPIMVGKTKLETADVINKDLTVIAFDFAPKFTREGDPMYDENGEVDTFAVVVFAEYPDSYYCVGTVFTNVCKAWMAGYETAGEASDDLRSEGGVRVCFKEGKTKKGNNLVNVEILG